jgi:uncharacterized protein YdaU (DUF1376 family)
MAEAPIMPFATDAFVADTTGLDDAETGAYMMLLVALWRSEDGTLPLDHRTLARHARCSPDQWAERWDAIKAFFTIEKNLIQQKRVTRDRLMVRCKIEKARENGRKGGRPKTLEELEEKPTGSIPVKLNETKTKAGLEKLTISISKSNKKYTPEGFDDWWAIYPRHTEKVAARKAFEKALSMTTLERLMDGAARYARNVQGKDPAYTKHPATWLNKGCWDDEAPQVVDIRNRMPSPAGG